MNTKLQLLVRRAKLKFARVLFLKSFYRTTVISNNDFMGTRVSMKGRYKLIVKEHGNNEVFELYDIQNDPHEERNLIDTYPEKVKQMHVELLEWQESVLHSLTGGDYVGDL